MVYTTRPFVLKTLTFLNTDKRLMTARLKLTAHS
jgi:hypothetical protein